MLSSSCGITKKQTVAPVIAGTGNDEMVETKEAKVATTGVVFIKDMLVGSCWPLSVCNDVLTELRIADVLYNFKCVTDKP